MTKADFLAEQARKEERRRMSIYLRSLISSEGRGGEDEGCSEQGQIDDKEGTRQSVYTQISIMALHQGRRLFGSLQLTERSVSMHMYF